MEGTVFRFGRTHVGGDALQLEEVRFVVGVAVEFRVVEVPFHRIEVVRFQVVGAVEPERITYIGRLRDLQPV